MERRGSSRVPAELIQAYAQTFAGAASFVEYYGLVEGGTESERALDTHMREWMTGTSDMAWVLAHLVRSGQRGFIERRFTYGQEINGSVGKQFNNTKDRLEHALERCEGARVLLRCAFDRRVDPSIKRTLDESAAEYGYMVRARKRYAKCIAYDANVERVLETVDSIEAEVAASHVLMHTRDEKRFEDIRSGLAYQHSGGSLYLVRITYQFLHRNWPMDMQFSALPLRRN